MNVYYISNSVYQIILNFVAVFFVREKERERESLSVSVRVMITLCTQCQFYSMHNEIGKLNDLEKS